MTVPVLMYHSVAADPADAARGLSVHPDRFAAQLDLLAAEGFTTLTFGELAAVRRGEVAAPERPIVLTFDDGYADFHREALPRLVRARARATVFVTTGWLDDAGRRGRRPAAGPDARPGRRSTSATTPASRSARTATATPSSTSCRTPPCATSSPAAGVSSRSGSGTRCRTWPTPTATPARGCAGPWRTPGTGSRRPSATSRPRRAPTRYALPRLTVARDTDLDTFGRVVRGEQHARIYWKQRTLTAGYLVVRRGRSALAAVSSGRRPS